MSDIAITLREVTTADIPELVRLEQTMSGSRVYSPMLTDAEWREAFQKEKIFLIESEGIVVGNLSYESKSDESLSISGLIVDPVYQGKGIASAVLAKVLTQFSHAKRVELVTHPENERALALYKKFGFLIESRVENYFDDGEPRLILAKIR